MNTSRKKEIEDRIEDGYWRGISCGAGWDAIIETTDRLLAAIFPEYKIHQIKEKFGGLRYYWSQSEDKPFVWTEIGNVIVMHAERASVTTCEECGMPGETKLKRGQYRTVCDEHYRQWA